MTAAPKYDGRRAKALEAEMLRRAQAVLTGDGRNAELGTAARAIIAVAARLEEEVTKRLDQVPAKQADNFYTAAGIGRDPARPAALPVAFKLVDGATTMSAPAATQLIASGAEPVVFETDIGIDLVPGTVIALRGLDASSDSISKPSVSVVEAKLPRGTVSARRLVGGAGTGATKLQIDPAAGLKPATLLSLGDGDDAREYVASAVEGDLVTVEPPLESELQRDSPVREVAEFAPFARTSRNYQSHALYLGHSTLLDLPSTATIAVGGVALPPETEWSWWGKLTDDETPAWQPFQTGRELAKPAGKFVKTKINGLESLWLRARLPGSSALRATAQDVRLAVGGALCNINRDKRCSTTMPSVGFNAIANTIPIVTNAPFQPFGREPRLYDSFYLGSDEAFAKAGAEISVCFDLAGADLGQLVVQPGTDTMFGVGTDGLLYFVQLPPVGPKIASPKLQSLPPPPSNRDIVRLKPRSPIAYDGSGQVIVVAADQRSIFLAKPGNLNSSPTVNWTSWSLPAGAGEIKALAVGRDGKALFALDENRELHQWDLDSKVSTESPRKNVRELLQVDDSVLLVIGKDDDAELALEIEGPVPVSVKIDRKDLPEKGLSAFADAEQKVVYIAGYDELEPKKEYRLRLAVAAPDGHGPLEQFEVKRPFKQALPVVFSRSDESIDDGDRPPPALTVATPRPAHVSWDENSDAKVDFEPTPIGESSNPERRISRSENYEVVQASDVGLLFRPVTSDEHQRELFSMARAAEWESVGPEHPANPALSWEYWNGESWWALATSSGELIDETSNFTVNGGVFFAVPKDIAATEVVGKKSYWIRARLIGGDYGEAEVVEVSTGVFRRNTSTIRAPTIVQLKLGYCALDPTLPEVVLTEDNLGFVDQTSANVAGLEIPVFTPVAELMNPPNAAETLAERAAETILCDDPCPELSEDIPNPCDAPGAYDSCNSPCIAPPGYRRPKAAEAKGFVRGIMVGFDQPFFGQTISLYVDARPTGGPVDLVAEILQGGRFVRAAVVSDSSFGLTEPGFLTLAFPKAPDESEMLGIPSHWLRLRPKTSPDQWAPVLRGIHVNAVLTHSVETHDRERLGASVAIEGQEFRLAGAPVHFEVADDIEIRVKEPLGEEEISDEGLDTDDAQLGPDWVRWNAVQDLADDEASERIFALDPNSGIIKFGDGRAGMIPPLGADVFAVRYKRVVGMNANFIDPGSQIQLLSPLAGVERVNALDYSAGGSDVEALDSARTRAAAKLRHGGRILTPADLEDYAQTLSPRIAQVRLDTQRGISRLIVAMRGADAQPSPADLREFKAAIRDVAGFGLMAADAFKVVAPRLLPLSIQLTLETANTDDFAEAALRAKAAIAALFDPATGCHDGRGWPIGRLPDEQDLAAALRKVERFALLTRARIERSDRERSSERGLPERIPADVLVRIDLNDIDVQRAQEMAA